MIEHFVRHQPSGPWAYDLLAVQDAVGRILNRLAEQPHLDADLIEKTSAAVAVGLTLTAGQENLLVHGLGQPVRGWWIADIQTPALIWRIATPSSGNYNANTHLALGTSATATVIIVVF